MTKTAVAVTLKTGPAVWSTITVEATDPSDAITQARRFLGGNYPVTRIV